MHHTSGPHRHSIFCILPPHILRRLAEYGTPDQRRVALHALALDTTARTRRLLAAQRIAVAGPAVPATGPAQVQREIDSARNAETVPGRLIRAEGSKPSGDSAVDEAYDGLGDTFDFYWNVYQRNSIDGHGMALDATVHYSQQYDNAFWDGQRMIFGDGDGVVFGRFTQSLDVIGHELTHGVTAHEVNLVYQNQSGALNESISDVFGSLVKQFKLNQTADQADWLIGAALFLPGKVKGIALRSMKSPGSAYDDPTLGKDPQPDSMEGYVTTAEDNGGVHINSGIPNRAFYLVASTIGGYAWQKAGRIWYETIRDPALSPSASFADFALRTAINAGHFFGEASPERKAVVDAWGQVGVPVAAPVLAMAPGARAELSGATPRLDAS